MKHAIAILALVALAAPTASANSIVENLVDSLVCTNPGYQGTIATVPYFVWVDGTGWVGPYYHVYYTTSYERVDRYNYCVANVQVGAVSTSYGGSSSYDACVNCPFATDETDTLP